MIARHIQMGPMSMTTNGPCEGCHGHRTVAKGTCGGCGGSGFIHEETALPVIISKGSRPGDVIVFPEACSDSHDYEKRGDVHIRLTEADDPEGWTRKGIDLHFDFNVGLSEAMCGTRRVVRGHPRHPEGFYMLVLDVPIVTGDTIILKEMGMPGKENPETCGNAYLHVHVYPTKEERLTWATEPPKRSPTIGNVFDEVITMPVLSPSEIKHIEPPTDN
jgi:DnaJ-class molecular chaperone